MASRVCKVASTPKPKRQNNPEWDRLLSAAQKNNANEIRRLVTEEGVSASHANGIDQSALHIASLWGNVEAVETLLSLSANVNAQNNITGATPLHSTIQSSKQPASRRVTCTQILISKGGADASLADYFGATPLDYLNKMIEDESSWVDDEAEAEYCRAMREVLTGDSKALVVVPESEVFGLVKAGDVQQFESYIASRSGGDLVVELETRDKAGLTPLLCALEEVRAVCRRREDAAVTKNNNNTNSNTGTETWWIHQEDERRMNDLIRIVTLLLERGAQPNTAPKPPPKPFSQIPQTTQKDEETKLDEAPLHIVCNEIITLESEDVAAPSPTVDLLRSQLQQIATVLHTHSATISLPTRNLLHDAARRGYLTTLRFLVETLGIKPDEKGRQGMTPLHFAARSGRLDVVRYLVEEAGVDTEAVDGRGKTALYLAEVNCKEEVVAVLKDMVGVRSKG